VQSYQFVIIGGGVMGAATAWALAGSGKSVLLLEQFELGHKRGSSHGASRIFRFSYPDSTYVRMAIEALPLWRRVEAESGEQLLTVTGGLDRGDTVADNARALAECGVPHEVIDGREASRRFSMLSLPGDEPALFQADGGILAADRTLAALITLARAGKVAVRQGIKVLHLAEAEPSVRVVTADESFEAGVAVVTAGAWAGPLLETAGLRLPLRPTRETVAYFEMEGEPPPTLVDWGMPAAYALSSPGQGIKVGEHQAGPTVDPHIDGAPDQASVGRLSAWVRQRFPAASPTPHHSETCLYTNTPDDSFILERHGRVVVGSPCSGHGFKFAPLIGQKLAALATET
jgi:sarcosine oxidase